MGESREVFDVLPEVLREVPPMAGEESLYELVGSVLAVAERDTAVRAVLDEVAAETERDVIGPLFAYSNEGVGVGHGWGTLANAARFGDVDADDIILTGDRTYTVTFEPNSTPPVRGFWSLTLYDKHHFFAPNDRGRFSLGTKNQDLQTNEDGSLTIYVQHESPGSAKESNWLPAPADQFSRFLRAYWPERPVLSGQWTPPPVLATT